MIETLRALLQVQSIDAVLKQERDAFAALPSEREAAQSAHAKEAKRVESARAPVTDADRQHREMERQLADAEAQLAKLEEQKWEVTSKQAFAAMEREITQTQEAKSALEDQILEQLDVIENAETELANAEATQRDGEVQRAADEKERSAREGTLNTSIATLEGRRAEQTGLVDAATLKLYERVRSSKSPAVMMLKTVNCPGCHTALAPQTRNEIRRGEALIPCLRCGRLLYPETLEEAENG